MVRQLLTESTLLALLGGVAGLVIANWTAGFLVSMLSYAGSGAVFDFTLDRRILAFAAGLSLLTGIGFGVAPALTATRIQLAGILKGDDQLPRSGMRGLIKSLLVPQIALSLALLISAGLLIRTVRSVYAVDSGFERERVITAWAFPSLIGYEDDAELGLYHSVLDHLNTTPVFSRPACHALLSREAS